MIMSDLGDVEDEIFKKRQQNELAFKQREKNKKRRMEAISNYKPNWVPAGQFAPTVSFKEILPRFTKFAFRYLSHLSQLFLFVSAIGSRRKARPKCSSRSLPNANAGQKLCHQCHRASLEGNERQ